MSPTVASALTDFVDSLTAICFSLINSVVAFAQAIFVLGKDFIAAFINLASSLVGLALGLFQGVWGLIAGTQFTGVYCSGWRLLVLLWATQRWETTSKAYIAECDVTASLSRVPPGLLVLSRFMSRIPVPTSHTSSPSAPRALSPTPFPSEQPSRSMSTLSNTQSFPSPGGVSETRKKQSKRDEAIRKKIESELSRKRTISTTNSMRSGRRGGRVAAAKGTVAALRPSPALTVPENITVSEASQLCAAKRTDCVLVVDEEEGLSGIFTAKDMAYRVTAEGLDPHSTQVHQIMTRNPMVTRDSTSATEALQLMVSKHFRHLPVCNEEGNVVGLLDITKVFHEALAKVERSSVASEQLFAAMAGVQSELGATGGNPQATAMLAWAERLREKTALPDLTTVMDVRSHPATVGPKTTVREAARLMKERRTTAVCVMETISAPGGAPMEKIAGIFTSKDVVLRVIAAGLDAGRCSVVRVMTPHPDTAPPSMTIHDALKKMHNGHYLNLPVVEETGHLMAIIDVLTLTYATLEQMNAMTSNDNTSSGGEGEGGPMWGRFFDSIGHDDNDSYLSGSRATPDIHSLASMQHLHHPQSPHSEVHPNDSASVIDDEPSAVGGRAPIGTHSVTGAPPVDDGTYVFKFRTPSGRTHRFQARHDNVEHLREIVAGKLAVDPFFTEFKSTSDPAVIPDPIDFHLSYTDADGDSVFITADHDVMDAVKIARTSGADRVVLVIHGGKGWALGTDKNKDVAPEPETPAPAPVPAVDAQSVKSALVESNADLLLPASIVTLAVAIIGVFATAVINGSHITWFRPGTMVKSLKEEACSTLANRLFNVMLEDLVMDVALQAHHQVSRSLSVCPVCNTRCSAAHAPAASSSSQVVPSRPSTPTANGSSGTGTNTPTKEGNLYLECLVCSRQVASNRYAPHLSSCMGLSTTRRTAARGSALKSKPSSEAGGSTPSEDGDFSDDGKPKGKLKSKSNDGDFNLKRKRDSPSLTPSKKQKSHTSGSPLGRLKSESDLSAALSIVGLHDVKEPALRAISSGSHIAFDQLDDLQNSLKVARFVYDVASSSESPGGISSHSSFSINGNALNGHGKAVAPLKQPSPPRASQHYMLDDDSGDETGSSTDTDS
ncbi:hypothetical protein MKEN_00808700 [Mycena kentingensis (nom. inval.)]|nr:hypothetical protein MKEN_00808700 [Mycena kentingensis (nom. inval.)]